MLSYPGKCNKTTMILDSWFWMPFLCRFWGLAPSPSQYPFGMDDHKPYTSIVHSHHVWTPHMGTKSWDTEMTRGWWDHPIPQSPQYFFTSHSPLDCREKVGKSRNTVFLQWFGAPEGRKVGSLKRRVRSQLARWEMKNCTPLWREAHLQVKMYKTHHCRTTFGSCDVEKVHAVVARSTFRSQNVQNTPLSDDFWKLRCRKSARRCGAKHISKSKCTKHTTFGPLLEVAMSKKCTPLWREAHFEVKMYKTHHVRTIFGGSDVVSCGRRKG